MAVAKTPKSTPTNPAPVAKPAVNVTMQAAKPADATVKPAVVAPQPAPVAKTVVAAPATALAAAPIVKSVAAPTPVAPAAPVAKPVVAPAPAAKVAVAPPVVTVKAAVVAPKAAAVVPSAKKAPIKIAAPVVLSKPAKAVAVSQPAKPAVEVKPAPESKPAKPAVVAKVQPSISPETMLKGVEDLLDFSKAQAEAVVASSNKLALGLQQLAHSVIQLSQNSFEESVKAGQDLAAAKNIQEIIELSQSAAQAGLDKVLSEGSRLGTLSTKLVEETVAPLQSCLAAAVGRFTSRAA